MRPHTDVPILAWAIDPHETSLVPSKSALSSVVDFHIFPFSVSTTQSSLDHERLESFVGSFSHPDLGPHFKPPTILTPAPSQEPIVLAIEFAKSKNAHLIALTSHGRSGLERMFLGSFAEKLLDHSPIPVLFLTSGSIPAPAPGRALFATDFSLASKNAFREFLQFARHSVKEVILFHANELPVQIMAASEIAGAPLMIPSLDTQGDDAWAEGEAKKWIAELNPSVPEVRIHGLIKSNVSSVSLCILEICSKEKIGLVGITAEKGPLERTLFGSIARNLFRKQNSLVWVSNRRIHHSRGESS